MDVTSAIKTWQSGSNGKIIPNYGFLLQFSDVDERNLSTQGQVSFFSRETHTVYVPKLIMFFDDSTFNTGSMSEINFE